MNEMELFDELPPEVRDCLNDTVTGITARQARQVLRQYDGDVVAAIAVLKLGDRTLARTIYPDA